jgi:hypothetical protein
MKRAIVLLPLLLAACDGPNVSAGVPELVVEPEAIDFGETVIGDTKATVTAKLVNDGLGFVTVTGAEMTATSQDFTLASYFTEPIAHGTEAFMEVEYKPDYEGQDYGTITLQTDMDDDPETTEDESIVEVPLSGFGVLPIIELDPELLYFGTVAAGDTVELPFTVSSKGSGKLVIRHIIEEDPDDVFEWSDPAGNCPDGECIIENGLAMDFSVIFSPLDTDEHEGALIIETNDRSNPYARLTLKGNSVDNPDENVCPVVEIVSPDNGEFILDDRTTHLEGVVVDPDDTYSNLDCTWFGDGNKVAESAVQPDGRVEADVVLTAGMTEVSLRCIDLEVCAGDDEVEVEVVSAEEPLRYTISGGSSVFDYFAVDDELTISINGTPIHNDTDGTSTTSAPIEFEAKIGDTIRIVATDVNQCKMSIDELTLHWGTGDSQKLNKAECKSACTADACYDKNYNGPWPSVFLDETYTISIP